MRDLIVVTGQTATGKTSYAIKLAKKYNGELINADSRQVYKYLTIVTGKDLAIIDVPIHLYDIADPKKYFSSFDYKNYACKTIEEVQRRGKLPIIVGGTYLYLKHLLYGVETERIPPDWKLRKVLENKPIQKLQEILKKNSLQSFKQLNQSDRNNSRRLIRKIEIALFRHHGLTHRHPELDSGSSFPMSSGFRNKFGMTNTKIIGLRFKKKEALRRAIEKRVEERMRQGALDEVKKLLVMGYKETDPGLQTIGYKQLIALVRGKLTYDEAIKQWTTKEVQYAKRQYTFMKKDPHIKWIGYD